MKELRKFQNMYQYNSSEDHFLTLFFTKLSFLNIEYCVLRNYEKLPHSLGGSDLDILISKKDIIGFYNLLEEVLQVTQGKIIIKYGKLTPRICISGMLNGIPYGLQLDIHEGILPYKTVCMFPVDFVLSRINIYNKISVANDDDANIIAFLKEIFNNNKCKEKYFEDAKISWNKNNLLYVKALVPIYNQNFIEVMTRTLKNKYNQTNILNLAKLGQSILNGSISIKTNNIISRFNRFYRFFNPPGFTIAVLGTDGAGKTTIINAIREPLNNSVHNALYYEHMRPNLIPNIAQLFGEKKHSGSVSNPHSLKPSGFIGSFLRLSYYSFDYIFGYWIKIYPITVKKSSIWIFDRYYYDYLIDPKRARINLPNWIIKGISHFIYKPDLILCFGTKAEIIYNRKPELPLNEIKIQVDKLKEFCENTSNAVWIDTGVSIDKSIEKTYKIVIDNMAKRYEDE